MKNKINCLHSHHNKKTIIFIGLLLLSLFNMQSAFAEDLCPQNDELACLEPTFSWGSDYYGNQGYPSEDAVIAAINQQRQAQFDECTSRIPHGCILATIVAKEVTHYWDAAQTQPFYYRLTRDSLAQQALSDGSIETIVRHDVGDIGVLSLYECPSDFTFQPVNERYYCVQDAKFSLQAITPPVSCNENNDMEGNPCNPASGNKLQAEVDYLSSRTRMALT